MAWLGIWFEHEAEDGRARSAEYLRGLVRPVVYPYAHSFVEAEEVRLRESADPSRSRVDGEPFNVFYSLSHDGGQTGLEQQGCRVLNWLFENFDPTGQNVVSARFNEIPVVIHEHDPIKAAAMGNALTLLRFLGASEDQAIAKILLHPWNPLKGNPRLAAEDYEKRAIAFLHGESFYPEGIDAFDVLARRDLRSNRALPPCCETQIGFMRSLLEWVDECWPETPDERAELTVKLRNSLDDEAKYRRRIRRAAKRQKEGAPYLT